jgi:DNA replication protein DnaC
MIEATMEKLIIMKLSGMAEGLREQVSNPAYGDLSFEERLGILVDKEKLHRENRQLKILLSHARLRHPNACFENIDFRTRRGLAKDVILKLSQNEVDTPSSECHHCGPHRGRKNVPCLCPGK